MDQATQLRNIIKNVKVNINNNRSRVITVTSGKGGVGKSNITVNLAINFRKKGKRVIIFDADFGLANVEIIFGIAPKYTLFDMIDKGMNITDILTNGPYGIEFISGGSGIKELTNMNHFQINYMLNKLHELDKIADIIIIDTGAGISDIVLSFIFASKEIILVTTPEPTAITDAYAILKTIKNRDNYDEKDIKLVVNKVSSEKEGLEIFNKLNTVVKKFLNVKISNSGYLPYDKSLEKAVIAQKPVSILYPKSNISKGFEKLSENILYNNVYEENKKNGIGNIFSKILKIDI